MRLASCPPPLALLCLLCLASAGCDSFRDPPAERIVLIVVDTLRRDRVSAYSDRVATPNIQRIADRGAVYRNAVSSFYQTTMSMAALMTGRMPSLEGDSPARPLPWNGKTFCGMARFSRGAEDSCVPDVLQTVAEDLAEAGYWTAGVVANRLLFRPYGYDQGFDTWIEVGSKKGGRGRRAMKAAAVARGGSHVNREVRKLLASRPSDSLFLYVHYLDVHDYPLFPRRDYEARVVEVDRWIGDLLDALESESLLENASIVLVSDHGESFMEPHPMPPKRSHKGNPAFEQELRVPLIVAPAPLDDDLDRLIRSQDIGNMLRLLAGLPTRGRPHLEDDELFLSENNFHNYRKGTWKSMWHRQDDTLLLFDLEADPEERTNVALQHPGILKAHAERIRELTDTLKTERFEDSKLSNEDRKRLRALGYLE